MKRNKISKHKRGAEIGRRLLSGVALLGLSGVIALACTMSGDESSESSVVQKVHDVELFELDVRSVCNAESDNEGDACTTDDECLPNDDPDTTCGVGDGNTVNEGTDDWADVYAGTSNAFATSFKVDTFNDVIPGFPTPENSFWKSGSSHVQAISEWEYDTLNSTVPEKNDILHAFAAAYDEPGTGDTIFYFGLDTYSVQGAAQAGFWFFRQQVALVPLEPGETVGTFSGEHSEGDLLVLVSYEQGGKVGNVLVYEWQLGAGPGGKDFPIEILDAEADCADAPNNDVVCGVINLTPGENPPWNYLRKGCESEPRDPSCFTYESAAFVEFGLNISELLDGDIGCFSSFLANTQAGLALSSSLKDLTIDEFAVCGIDVVKEVDGLAKVGDEVTYEITVENTGRATLYKQSIIDTLDTNPPTVTDLSTNPGCGASLAPGATCTISYTRTVLATDPDPLENTVEILYTEFDGFGQEFEAEYTGTTNLFQPDIALDKTVQDAGGTYVEGPITVLQGATVNYKAVLTDESSDDAPDLNCTTTDANLPGLDGTVIPLTTTAQQVFQPIPGWCTDDGESPPTLYTCVNTVETTCTISDFCEDPQNPTPETCLTFDNVLEADDSVTVEVVPADVALTVTKECDDFSKAGDTVSCGVVITNEANIELTLDSIEDVNDVPETRDLTGDCVTSGVCDSTTCGATLAVDASCTIAYSRETLDTDPEVINNEVTVEFSDAFGGSGSQSATDSVDIIHPSYSVTKECIPPDMFPVPPGTFVNFRIDTENTGDADLVLTSVDDTLLGELLAPAEQSLPVKDGGACTEDDFMNGVDGCYRIEESYQVTEDVTNQVDVDAKLAATYGLPNTFTESDGAECDVQEGLFSCTWGFWKTHGSDGYEFDPPVDFGYTCYVAETYVGFPIPLGWTDLQDCGDVFGLFWENKAQCTQLEKTQIQASRQFLAAILNDAKFGTPIPDDCKKGKKYEGLSNEDLFDLMREALADGNRRKINSLGSVFACYNEYYPCGPILDSVPIPHADPNGTRAVADFDLVTCGK